jgi:hypothetical protein
LVFSCSKTVFPTFMNALLLAIIQVD